MSWTETDNVKELTEEEKAELKKKFGLLEEGRYRLKVVSFKVLDNFAKTDKKWVIESVVVAPLQFANRRLWPDISCKPSVAFKRQEAMHAICPEMYNDSNPWGVGSTVPDNIIGRTYLADIIQEPKYQKPNELKNRVKKFHIDPEAVIPTGSGTNLGGLSSGGVTATPGGFIL